MTDYADLFRQIRIVSVLSVAGIEFEVRSEVALREAGSRRVVEGKSYKPHLEDLLKGAG
jgi:hypothetical protein